MEQPKKKSKAQLEHEIETAIVYVPKKGSKTVRLDDRGLTFTTTDTHTIVSSNFHRNVFSNYTSSGVGAVSYYVGQFVDIIEKYQEYGKMVDDKGNVTGCSFQTLLDNAHDKMDEDEIHILQMVDRWSVLLCEPLYSLAPTEVSGLNRNVMFLSYLAKNWNLLAPHEEDIMYNEFMNKYIASLRYLSMDDDVNCEGLEEEILRIETEAMDKIQAFVESKGITWVDKIAISKRESNDDDATGA